MKKQVIIAAKFDFEINKDLLYKYLPSNSERLNPKDLFYGVNKSAENLYDKKEINIIINNSQLLADELIEKRKDSEDQIEKCIFLQANNYFEYR